MINPLNELSDIYLGQISEADNSPEAVKGRVMQHVRAIRYRARKEGDQLTKAYNDYMASQSVPATEKQMVKERLGLTGGQQHQEGLAYGLSKGSGKPSGAMKKYLDNAKKLKDADDKKKKTGNPAFDDPSHHSNRKNRTEGVLVNVAKGVESGVKKFNKFDDRVTKAATKKVGKVAKKVGMAAVRGTAGAVGGAVKGAFQGASKGIKKGMREDYSDWRVDLSEYSGSMPMSKPKKLSDTEKEVTEKKVNNKVTVNPLQGQAESLAVELGGQLIEACEVFQMMEVGVDQVQLLEVKDRKGKGSGTKDACYHKVKSRYSVWPSAYASGALVKCRRVGAANWGNSTKKEDIQWKDREYHSGAGESTFLSDSQGNVVYEIVDVIVPAHTDPVAEEKKPMVKVKLNPSKKIGVKVTDIGPGGKEVVRKNTMDEDYETKKRAEIMGALKKRDLKQKVKEKIAADIIKRKGDTSKSDDRYAYESVGATKKYLDNVKKERQKFAQYLKKKKEKVETTEAYGGTGVSRKAKLGSTHPPTAQAAIKNIPTETDRGAGNKAKRRAGMSVEKKSPTYKAYVTNKEEVEKIDEVSKGTLGNYVRKATQDLRNQSAVQGAETYAGRSFDIKGKYKPGKIADKRQKGIGKAMDRLAKEETDLDEKCWAGYEKKGMKTMFGKRYPNCVKKKTKKEEVEFQEKLNLKKADMGDVVKDFYKSDAPQFKGRSKKKRREMAIAAKLTAERGKLPEEVVTELNRFEKEKRTDTKTGKPVTKGGTAKNDKAFQSVMKKYGKQRMGANQPKKVKGAKSTEGTGRITKMVAQKKAQQASNKAFASRAKKAGYKNPQDYANVVARYGSEKSYNNPNKYGGLGS